VKRIWVILSVTTVLLCPASSSAQTQDSGKRWQTSFVLAPIGTGWPGPEGHSLMASRIGLSVGKNNHWFTVAADYLDVLAIDFSWGAPSDPIDQYWDIDVLYGRRFRQSDIGYFYAGAGVAMAHSILTVQRKQEHLAKFGLPIELRGVVKTSPHFGFVFCLFETITEHSFGGIAVGVQIGP
jgi:hypothetical protein